MFFCYVFFFSCFCSSFLFFLSLLSTTFQISVPVFCIVCSVFLMEDFIFVSIFSHLFNFVNPRLVRKPWICDGANFKGMQVIWSANWLGSMNCFICYFFCQTGQLSFCHFKWSIIYLDFLVTFPFSFFLHLLVSMVT